MGEWFKKNVIQAVMGLLTTVMAGIILLMFTSMADEIKTKPSRQEVQDLYIRKDEGATIDYVENQFRLHETREQIIIEGVKEAIKEGNLNIEALINIQISNQERRIQRLENKTN